MLQGSRITLENYTRWAQAFTVLSMDRCSPFFADMDLPPAIVASPAHVMMRSRNYLESVRLETDKRRSDAAHVTAVAQRALEFAFIQIAVDYDEQTAFALHAWCLRYVVEPDSASALAAWGHLFRRLCRMISDDEVSVEPVLDRDTIVKVCGVVSRYLQPGLLMECRQRIDEARTLPASEWEQWLEEQVRHSAGHGASLGAIDAALDLVEGVIFNHNVFQTWALINTQITAGERNHLEAWGRHQADRLGILSNASALHLDLPGEDIPGATHSKPQSR